MNRCGHLPLTGKSGGRNIRGIVAIGYGLYSWENCSVKTVEKERIKHFEDDVHVSIESEVGVAREGKVELRRPGAGYINCLGKHDYLETQSRYRIQNIAPCRLWSEKKRTSESKVKGGAVKIV